MAGILRQCRYHIQRAIRVQQAAGTRMVSSSAGDGDQVEWEPESAEVPIPEYSARVGEEVEEKRARLLYQSRKRGMLENGLLLSNFAKSHLSSLSPDLLSQYDNLINKPSNDWEIYYWVVGTKSTPEEYNTEVMDLLKEYCKNKDKQSRIRQPDLH